MKLEKIWEKLETMDRRLIKIEMDVTYFKRISSALFVLLLTVMVIVFPTVLGGVIT